MKWESVHDRIFIRAIPIVNIEAVRNAYLTRIHVRSTQVKRASQVEVASQVNFQAKSWETLKYV